jgi:hypothetical protein
LRDVAVHAWGRASAEPERSPSCTGILEPERKINNPAVLAICEIARKHIFT